jgi:hypothetical protein
VRCERSYAGLHARRRRKSAAAKRFEVVPHFGTGRKQRRGDTRAMRRANCSSASMELWVATAARASSRPPARVGHMLWPPQRAALTWECLPAGIELLTYKLRTRLHLLRCPTCCLSLSLGGRGVRGSLSASEQVSRVGIDRSERPFLVAEAHAMKSTVVSAKNRRNRERERARERERERESSVEREADGVVSGGARIGAVR